jgi:hypothetical protein
MQWMKSLRIRLGKRNICNTLEETKHPNIHNLMTLNLLQESGLGYPLPLDTNPTPPSTSHKNDDLQLNVDVDKCYGKNNVLVPLDELIKIPSQMDKVRKFLIMEEEPEDPHVVLQTMDYDRNNGGYAPFFYHLGSE